MRAPEQARRTRRNYDSMDLLASIAREPIDPDYRRVAATGRQRRHPVAVLVLVVLAGAVVSSSAIQTALARPEVSRERNELIERIVAQRDRTAELSRSIEITRSEVLALEAAALGAEASRYNQRLNDLGLPTGAVAVTGPGVVLHADDAQGATSSTQRVVDVDLRHAVNGLWQSGAEAIAINGHRLSSRTAIRAAGDAITVDYVSLSPPYRVEAIGDPATLEARFAETDGGGWWNALRSNYGIRYSLETVDDVRLPADPGLGVAHAKRRNP